MNQEGVRFVSVKRKSAMGLKLDDRYIAILNIAVKRMKADGIRSASKTDIIRQALEIYAREKQITNENISDNLHDSERTKNQEKGTAKAIIKHFGTWAGGKEDAEKVLKYIIENRSDAEF
jgi:hypothetical protein